MAGTSPVGLQPQLTIYTFDVVPHQYSFSQFCTKLRFRLRHAGINYTDGQGTRHQSPKGKIPYVRFHDSGELMGDSGLIAQRLVGNGTIPDLNGRLSDEDRARDLCITTLCENKMYFLLLHERWKQNYYLMRDHGPIATLPWPFRIMVAWMINALVSLMMWGEGTGRHNIQENVQLAREAHDAMAALLAAAYAKSEARDSTEPFWVLGGKEATEADFALFGYLIGVLALPPQPGSRKLLEESAPLMSYVQRIHWKYFPEVKSPFEPLK